MNKNDVKNMKITTSRTYTKKVGEDTDECETIEVGVFQADVAHVTVPVNITHNLGNYESVKTGVSITVPCYVEELDEAFNFAREFAERKAGEMSDFSQAYQEFMKRWRRGDYAT